MTKPLRRCPCGATVHHKQSKICNECRADLTKYQKAKWALAYRSMDDSAEEETAALPRQDAYTPMHGEYAVWKMQRGEW